MQNGENFDTFDLKVSTLKINKKVLCITFVLPDIAEKLSQKEEIRYLK